jgi:glutathione synthase
MSLFCLPTDPLLFHNSDGEKQILNERAGHLLRTKGHGTNEGGVAAGFAVIDSPLLL